METQIQNLLSGWKWGQIEVMGDFDNMETTLIVWPFFERTTENLYKQHSNIYI